MPSAANSSLGIAFCLVVAGLAGCEYDQWRRSDEPLAFFKGSLEGKTTKDLGYSGFGSVYAGRGYFDDACSDFHPHSVLCEPGELTGHWLGRGKMDRLTVERYDPKNPQHKGHWADEEGFPEDRLVVKIVGGADNAEHWPEAAYGAFAIYAVDIDGDGVDEVAMEYGVGRGTEVYVAHLAVFKIVAGEFRDILDLTLNGWFVGYSPNSEHPEGEVVFPPQLWERRYAFKRNAATRGLDIYVYLIPPASDMQYIGDEQITTTLKLTRQLFCYNPKWKTYELTRFQMRQLN